MFIEAEQDAIILFTWFVVLLLYCFTTNIMQESCVEAIKYVAQAVTL
jgi:hypothetical protein